MGRTMPGAAHLRTREPCTLQAASTSHGASRRTVVPAAHGLAPGLECGRRAGVRVAAPAGLRRPAPDGPRPDCRRARPVAPGDGARQRGLPAAARVGPGPLAEPRTLLRRVGADD